MTRSGQPTQQFPVSQLHGVAFEAGNNLRYELRRPTFAELRDVDRDWPKLRRAGADHAHWRWEQVAGHLTERWGLFAGATPVALWCSQAKKPLQLADGLAYAFDYIEVAPSAQADGLGALVLALVCLRAYELQADAVVFGALPQAESYFALRGAKQGCWSDWCCPVDLLPFHYAGEAFLTKVHHAQALRIDDNR